MFEQKLAGGSPRKKQPAVAISTVIFFVIVNEFYLEVIILKYKFFCKQLIFDVFLTKKSKSLVISDII